MNNSGEVIHKTQQYFTIIHSLCVYCQNILHFDHPVNLTETVAFEPVEIDA